MIINKVTTRNSLFFKKTNFKPLLRRDPDGKDTVSESGCEMVTDSAEENNSTSSPSTSMPRNTNNDIPSTGSMTSPIRKSTRVSTTPTRPTETMQYLERRLNWLQYERTAQLHACSDLHHLFCISFCIQPILNIFGKK